MKPNAVPVSDYYTIAQDAARLRGLVLAAWSRNAFSALIDLFHGKRANTAA